MFYKLLILSTAVCLALAADNNCGRTRRTCATKASCVNGTCICDLPLHGNSLVQCVNEDEFQCVLSADPHMLAFEDATGNLNYPCRYRMARVQSTLKGATPGLSFCAFEVFGYTKIVKGKYFTSGVEVSFAIGDFANQFFRQQDIIKFDINDEGVESSDGGTAEWGTGTHGSWNGIAVDCLFDVEQQFAILSVPQCEFEVRFRPFNPEESRGPQSQVPAISIVLGPSTRFGETELGRYPASLCGETDRQGDDEFLYTDRAQELGLLNEHQTLLYDAINQNIEQKSFVMMCKRIGDPFALHHIGPFTGGYPRSMPQRPRMIPTRRRGPEVVRDPETCQAVVDEFQVCSDANQAVDAILACGRILNKKRFRRCLGIRVLKVYLGCLKAMCGQESAGCDLYKSELSQAQCKGPRNMNRFCKK